MNKPEQVPPPNAQCDVNGILNEKQNSCVTQHLPSRVAVTYEVHFDTSLRLPYAFYWNGIKQPDGRIAVSQRAQMLTIRALAKQGEKVGIYLGSDASPDFRRELLYPLTVGANDVKAVIKSKKGLHDDAAELKLVKNDVPTGHGDKEDQYEGALTGDIWMRFSHRYTVEEASAYLSTAGEKDAGIAGALADLYGGKVTKAAGLSVRFDNQRNCQITFQQAGTDTNCTANIKKGYHFSDAGIPRVHPRAWIAVLQAARDSGVSSLEISSGWRPMLGSAAHRVGLGFDVKSVKNADGSAAIFDRTNSKLWTSDDEKTKHAQWVQSERDVEKAQRELKAAQRGIKTAKGEDGIKEAKQRENDAKNVVRDSTNAKEQARDSFLKSHKGSTTDSFEQALLKSPLVKQLYDPLLMDDNTQDDTEAKVNRNETSNETTHHNHLHITAHDRYLMP